MSISTASGPAEAGPWQTIPIGMPAARSQPDFELYYPQQFADRVADALAKTHDDKRTAKKKLLDDVKAWCNANPDDAKAAFKASAAEAIEKLREIDQALPH